MYTPPVKLFAKSVRLSPEQIGELLDTTGADGVRSTTTATVLCALVQPPTVTVSEYVPVAAGVTFVMDGSSNADEKLFGPVHAYVALATVFDVRFSV